MKKSNRNSFLLIFGLGLAAILLLIFLLSLPALQTDQQRELAALRGVPRVTIQEARRALEADEALIVDVRSRANFEQSHISGAISAPLPADLSYSVDAPLDAFIYLYCT
jgi:hypothetical protein